MRKQTIETRMQCEYCGRLNKMETEQCIGCGAPVYRFGNKVVHIAGAVYEESNGLSYANGGSSFYAPSFYETGSSFYAR